MLNRAFQRHHHENDTVSPRTIKCGYSTKNNKEVANQMGLCNISITEIK